MTKLQDAIARAISLIDQQAKQKNELLKILIDEKKSLTSQLQEIDVAIAKLGGEGAKTTKKVSKAASPVAIKKTKKRIRRGPEELKKQALGVVELVKGKKDGVPAGEIFTKFGPMFPSIAAFVKKFSGVKMRKSGVGSKTKYYV